MTWQTVFRLPEQEPNAHNLAAYQVPQLLAGASPDGQFIYDAIYVSEQRCFVLTFMHINNEWGFIEQQTRLYLSSRTQLLDKVKQFEQQPLACFESFVDQ